jgi:glycerol-3-phosphate acyltransferase PlsY
LLAAAAGNGVGRGAAGSANTFRVTGATLAAFSVAAALFSALSAVAFALSSAPLLLCWAQSGNVTRALSAKATDQFRIALLQKT